MKRFLSSRIRVFTALALSVTLPVSLISGAAAETNNDVQRKAVLGAALGLRFYNGTPLSGNGRV